MPNFGESLFARNITPQQQRLRRAASRAAISNPETAALTTGATQSVSTTVDAALTYRPATAGAIPNFVTVTGGSPWLRPANNAVYFPSGAYAGSSSNGNLGAAAPDYAPDASAWGYEVTFQTDAPKIQLRQNGGVTTHGFRFRVDGQYVDRAGTAYPSGSTIYPVLDFAGVRKMRTITYEGEFNVGIFSIDVDPISTVQKAQTGERVIAIGFGNSLMEGVGNSSPMVQQNGFFKRLARRVGWSDARQAGVGGTDFFRVGTNGRLPIMFQIPRLLIVNPDIKGTDVSVVAFSPQTNDISPYLAGTWSVTAADGTVFTATGPNDTVTYQALVAYTMRLTRRTFPDAMILLPGVWPQNLGLTSALIGMEQAMAAGLASLGDSNAYFIPFSTSVSPWLTGTGDTGTPNASGNADTYLLSDKLHPSVAGHDQLIAQRYEQAYRNILDGVMPL